MSKRGDGTSSCGETPRCHNVQKSYRGDGRQEATFWLPPQY